jgi:hypothetical protein
LGADFSRTIRRAINTLPDNPLIYRIRERRRNARWFLPPGLAEESKEPPLVS